MAKIGFIGMGNMGTAILNGLLRTLKPEEMLFTTAHQETMEQITERTGVPHAASNGECAKESDYLILAVKPQYFDRVFEEIRGDLKENQIVISLAPGSTIRDLTERLGGKVRVVRSMPNTPALLGEGMTGLCYERERFTEQEEADLQMIFSSCGLVELLEERQLEAVGCVSGCSPAFVYMFIQALADSGVKYGLPRKTACKMAAQAVLGSAKMVLETGKHPEQLKDEVCSPGGTTIEGVSALEQWGMRNSVLKAAEACYEKSKRL